MIDLGLHIKQGDVMVYTNPSKGPTGHEVLVSSVSEDNTFAGCVIKSDTEELPIGSYSSDWAKYLFKLKEPTNSKEDKNQSDMRIEVGTKVTCAYNGHGEVVIDDGSTMPYKVKFGNGRFSWYTKDLKRHSDNPFGLKLGHAKTFKQRIAPKKTKFKIGDEVTCIMGKGFIVESPYSDRPVAAKIGDATHYYLLDGRLSSDYPISLFKGHHDSITIEVDSDHE